jgi:beta-N-acetylhexosaminidase
MKPVHSHHAPVLLDIHGLTLSKVDRARLRHPLCGGVILFTRNWHSRAQLTQLCEEIKKTRSDLLICVDHEGGRVQRFKTDGFTHLTPMGDLGRAWMEVKARESAPDAALKAMDQATCMGYVMASELKACGVDFSFAPVLDLDYARSSVIGNRAFHRDKQVVSVLAKSFMQGMLQAGMANCGKHFPGHGYVELDSHVDMPVDDRSLTAIASEDLMPYGWLGSSLTSVMPAHVVYPKVDHLPAGFSEVWLKEILRERLEFTGAIISDDLSMQGARVLEGKEVTYAQAAVKALNAGCDLLLICNQSVIASGAKSNSTLDVFLDELTQALLTHQWAANEESEYRRLALKGHDRGLNWEALMREPAYHRALQRC